MRRFPLLHRKITCPYSRKDSSLKIHTRDYRIFALCACYMSSSSHTFSNALDVEKRGTIIRKEENEMPESIQGDDLKTLFRTGSRESLSNRWYPASLGSPTPSKAP